MKSSKIKQMFYKLENPKTSEKYRAYLDLLRVLKDILRIKDNVIASTEKKI